MTDSFLDFSQFYELPSTRHSELFKLLSPFSFPIKRCQWQIDREECDTKTGQCFYENKKTDPVIPVNSLRTLGKKSNI